ncbi:hypothetical protein [Burkholderia sp. L27(2015)]|uniref:hypothetical protein n=1 Tax=Burkholderia sp. L27(2015) TaxID=1641858 RepID=UPI001C202C84|nr:hypothetical protein [Burkholderia sp. L27(2015)]
MTPLAHAKGGHTQLARSLSAPSHPYHRSRLLLTPVQIHQLTVDYDAFLHAVRVLPG